MRKSVFPAMAFCLVTVAPAALATSQPTLKWAFEGQSNLYGPAIVADVHPAPGLECVVSDSEVRCVRCIDAEGNELWRFDGGWKRRLTSAPSVSLTARQGQATIAVGNGDGTLCCIDGESGEALWGAAIGKVEWGGVTWADLDADGVDELVVGTVDAGIQALEADGTPIWTYLEEDGSAPLVRCPVAAVDIDGDRYPEIFAAGRFGPFCLNADGALRWQTLLGHDFASSVVIGDANGDGKPELYCASSDDNATYCFDALTGAVRWCAPMIGKADVYPSSSIAVGDLDGDGVQEIVSADALGYVYCLDAAGHRRWLFETSKRTHAAPSLGDVDGDGVVDVLVTCGDHFLYCLDHRGYQKWRYAADRRLMYPATLCDVDLDGLTDIVFCGSDHTLRCLTLGGRYAPQNMPWPSRRFDAAQTGASFGKSRGPVERVAEARALLLNGGFELRRVVGEEKDYPSGSTIRAARANQPRGWHVESVPAGSWELDAERKAEGEASLRVMPEQVPLVLVSDPIAVESGLRTVSASIQSDARDGRKVHLRWEGRRGVLREDALAPEEGEAYWVRYACTDISPPSDAEWLSLVCTVEQGPAWWDAAEIEGAFLEPPAARVLVNQVGYEIRAPKRFTVRANFECANPTFEIIDPQGNGVHSGVLEPKGRIQGAFGNDWGYFYWRGAFDAFETPGTYRIRVTLGDVRDTSWPFDVAAGLLWAKTSRPAYRFFYYQRCGMEIPGFHGACHLDDAIGLESKVQYELWGGWHDAGDYNTYHNARYVFRLAQAYETQRERFNLQDEDGNGNSDFFDEILWGGDHSRRMISPDGSAYGGITSGYGFWAPPELETDNIPGTGDERPFDHAPDAGRDSAYHTAACAKIARYLDDNAEFIEAATRGLRWAQENERKGPLQCSAALDLYLVTKDKQFATLAKALLPAPGPDTALVIEAYDAIMGENHRDELRAALIAKANEMIALADNPFGVYTYGPKEDPNFFGTPGNKDGWHVGTSSYVLNAAAVAALAYAYEPDNRFLVFAYDQINWTLGNNPYDISLMEGEGSAFPPTYHHRYTFAGVPRGAVPGSVVNGITWRGVGDDRPYFDMRGLDIADFQSNEVWLPHNTAYLNALANLVRARDTQRPAGSR